MNMTWNSEEAKTWMIKFANLLNSNGETKSSQGLLYDVYYFDSCHDEASFTKSLKNNTNLDEVYIQWAIKEVRHDG